MAIFRSSPPVATALKTPPARRISLPVSERLSTITEGPRPAAASRTSHIQPRPISSRYAPSFSSETNRWSTGNASQTTTTRTGPPAYGWVPEPIEPEEDLRSPVEGEKLAQLREADDERRDGGSKKARGGWGRLLLILAAVLIVLGIALGVGLGVGLKKHQSNDEQDGTEVGSQQTSTAPQPFPLGEYSLATVLREQNTSCTSNSATWRCYPNTVYDPSNGATNTSSIATFNWILTNTSSTFPTNETTDITTSDEGIPSNLTISAVDNPFAIAFTNQSLTYIHPSSDLAAARLTFTFEMSKSVIPSTSLTSNNAATICFFNATIFTGTLYLNASAVFPSVEMATDAAVGGTNSTAWPYAVEIAQTSPAGTNVPACYLTTNGNVGARILTGPAPISGTEECICDYRNF
nr:hypothetical protein CFP56_07894 [Quercus suber]